MSDVITKLQQQLATTTDSSLRGMLADAIAALKGKGGSSNDREAQQWRPIIHVAPGLSGVAMLFHKPHRNQWGGKADPRSLRGVLSVAGCRWNPEHTAWHAAPQAAAAALTMLEEAGWVIQAYDSIEEAQRGKDAEPCLYRPAVRDNDDEAAQDPTPEAIALLRRYSAKPTPTPTKAPAKGSR